MLCQICFKRKSVTFWYKIDDRNIRYHSCKYCIGKTYEQVTELRKINFPKIQGCILCCNFNKKTGWCNLYDCYAVSILNCNNRFVYK
jgi:hypothetical protein